MSAPPQGPPPPAQPPASSGGFCCGAKDDKPKTYEHSRSCTDCLFLLVYIAYWIGFIIVAAVAFSNGDPDRIIYGTDYLGFVCGKGDGPEGFSNFVKGSAHQSTVWSENTELWMPIPTSIVDKNYTKKPYDMAMEAIQFAICVKTCPAVVNETIYKNFDMNFFINGFTLPQAFKVFTYGNKRYKEKVNATRGTFPIYNPAFYNSESLYHRCVPQGISNFTLIKPYLEQIPEVMEVTKFFMRGITEIASSWRVILICVCIALVFSFIYVNLMRVMIYPLVIVSMILVFVCFLGLGWFMYNQAKELESTNERQENKESDQYIKFWYSVAYISWAIAGAFVFLCVWFWRRISEACSMIQIGGRVITSGPALLILPICTAISICLVLAWSIAVAIYIYTSVDYSEGTAIFGTNVLNQTTSYTGNNTLLSNSVTGTVLSSDANSKRNLIAYTLFGYLWTSGFLSAIGFTITAFCSVFWYFSPELQQTSSTEPAGYNTAANQQMANMNEKAIPVGGLFKATWWTLVYHTGTLAFGTLLVAIVQFIRIMIKYLVAQAEKVSGRNDVNRFIACVADCILGCFEKILKIVSKNAYIMMCITNEGFCCAARRVTDLIVSNASTMIILNIIEEIVIGLGKVITVAGCVVIGYGLMHYDSLAPGVQTRILPLLVIAFGTYFVSSVFFNVYTVCIDACFICFHYDKEMNQGYYAPNELLEFVNGMEAKRAAAEAAAAQAQQPQQQQPQQPRNDPVM